MEEFSNEDVTSIIDNEGLSYAIQHYIGSNQIEDPKLAVLWKEARCILDKICDYLGIE